MEPGQPRSRCRHMYVYREQDSGGGLLQEISLKLTVSGISCLSVLSGWSDVTKTHSWLETKSLRRGLCGTVFF